MGQSTTNRRNRQSIQGASGGTRSTIMIEFLLDGHLRKIFSPE